MPDLVVREFDRIEKRTPNRDRAELRGVHFLEEADFNNLKAFVEENFGVDENDIESITQFMTCRNNAITIRNYVGVIELPSGLQIEILPKIHFGENPESWDDAAKEKSRQIFLKMLSHLNEFPCKVSNFTNLESRKMHLFDVFINMYATAANELVKRGLKSSYVSVEGNLHVYKGKLKVPSHIKYNAAHKECFYVEYDEFQLNRPENKLIKSTLLYLQKQCRSESNRKLIRQVLNHFDEIEPSLNIDSDLAKIKCDRNTREYCDLMAWSKVFLKHESFSTFHGPNKTKALLFPMEKIFESYIAGAFRQTLANDVRHFSWDVSTQDRGKYLFYNQNEYRQSGIFSLRPDIVVRGDNRIVILDTKWKSLSTRKTNFGISQGDMYQMYAYAHKYQTPEIFVLYPLNAEMKEYSLGLEHPQKIDFWGDECDTILGKKIHVQIFFVDLETILEPNGVLPAQWASHLVGRLN